MSPAPPPEDWPVRVRVLGSFEVEGVPARALGSRKGRTLLKVLAVAAAPAGVGRSHRRRCSGATTSRPDPPTRSGCWSRACGACSAPSASRGPTPATALVADWLDVDELRDLTAAAARALADGRVGAARAAAGAALALARRRCCPTRTGRGSGRARRGGGAVRAGPPAGGRRRGRRRRSRRRRGPRRAGAGSTTRTTRSSCARSWRPTWRPAGRRRRWPPTPGSGGASAEDLGVAADGRDRGRLRAGLAAADGDAAGAPAGAHGRPGAIVGAPPRWRRSTTPSPGQPAPGAASSWWSRATPGSARRPSSTAWSQRARGGAVVLRGRCDELGRDLPLQPVADALADHLRAVGAERAADVLGDDAAALAPLLGPVGRVDGDGRGRRRGRQAADLRRPGRGARPRRRATADACSSSRTSTSPVPARWRGWRSPGVAAGGTLLVHDDAPGGARGLDATDHITLGALDRDAVAELVGADRADALLRAQRRPPAAARRAGESPDEALPATVRDAVGGRVDSLGRRGRHAAGGGRARSRLRPRPRRPGGAHAGRRRAQPPRGRGAGRPASSSGEPLRVPPPARPRGAGGGDGRGPPGARPPGGGPRPGRPAPTPTRSRSRSTPGPAATPPSRRVVRGRRRGRRRPLRPRRRRGPPGRGDRARADRGRVRRPGPGADRPPGVRGGGRRRPTGRRAGRRRRRPSRSPGGSPTTGAATTRRGPSPRRRSARASRRRRAGQRAGPGRAGAPRAR